MNQDIRICFIGDSFVNGTGDETALGWAGRLAGAANARGRQITYYNLGIRRNTSGDILQRWESECALRLPELCDGRVVLSCGVNDTVIENGTLRVAAAQSRLNVQQMLRQARNYKVIMVGPPPIDDDEQNQRIMALSRSYAEEAQALGVPYIELYSQLVSDPLYRSEVANNDGAHPQSKGYRKMAEIIGTSPYWWFPWS